MCREIKIVLALSFIFLAISISSTDASLQKEDDGELDICYVKNEQLMLKLDSVLQLFQSRAKGSYDFKAQLSNITQNLRTVKRIAEKFANYPVELFVKVAERAELCAKAESLGLVELVSGKYYFNSNTSHRLNWREAKNFCETHGMQLLVIRTEKEMKEVWNAAPAKHPYDDFWLGAIDGYPGQFSWLDGRQINKKWWLLGQPDRYGRGQNSCVYLHDGKLWDMECSFKNLFICRLTSKYCL